MSEEIQIITAVTALAAVILGPLVSIYVVRVQVRASVVSANRQVWINTLRDTIAEYLAKQAMARNLNHLEHADNQSLSRIEEMLRLNTKIELLANPNEDDHAKLIQLICDLTNTTNRTNAVSDSEIDASREKIISISQSILKREWTCVKKFK